MKAIAKGSICLVVIVAGACRPTGFEIGGGGSTHLPPERIIVGKPTPIDLELSVWGEGAGKLSKRWADVKCHYRIVGEKEYATISMKPKHEYNRVILFTCVIPPQDRDGATLEYYFDMLFDGHYNRRDGGRVVIVGQKENKNQGEYHQ